MPDTGRAFLIFQLTPSRRATVGRSFFGADVRNFNSRPHGGRLRCTVHLVNLIEISTHALTEGDVASVNDKNIPVYFNSRPHGGRLYPHNQKCLKELFQLTPSRRATAALAACRWWPVISTHALTEGDVFDDTREDNLKDFNSRPHGGRHILPVRSGKRSRFQLTPSRRATFMLFHNNVHVIFQLTPSRRATISQYFLLFPQHISTHALTEGDGKFRQIFLLNRGYAYSISLYFLPHFISLLPQILSFQQKSFKFQVRIFLLFSVHLAFALQNQCVHHVKSRFCTNMFYFVFVLFTQIVKPQTIGLFIYDFF